ncbi:Calx-beta domain-containing protein [Mycolicibacterium chlorophenolicum]|nr:Calx-beta domain-containing protein [Mycolicibacterium chlorophenolicum]
MGALAVALGIGAAVASLPAVAVADPAGSDDSHHSAVSNPSSSTDSADPGQTHQEAEPQSGPSGGASADDATQDSDEADEDAPAEPDAPASHVVDPGDDDTVSPATAERSGRHRSHAAVRDGRSRSRAIEQAAEPDPRDASVTEPAPAADDTPRSRTDESGTSQPLPTRADTVTVDAPASRPAAPARATPVRTWLATWLGANRRLSAPGDPVSPAVVPLMWGAALAARREERLQSLRSSVETFSLKLSAARTSGSTTITVGFPQSVAYLAEGDSGSRVELLTVRLSGAAKTTVTVQYTVSVYPGSGYKATAGEDFNAATGSLVFTPGQTSATIPVTILGDTAYEPDEAFRVQLTSAVGALIVRTAGQLLGQTDVILTNDDAVSGIGMTLHLRGADAAAVKKEFDLMSDMGVTWVRIDIDWSAVQPKRRSLNWAPTDLLVNEAVAHQMSVLVTIAYTPEWARSTASRLLPDPTHARPTNLSDLANFASLAARRYAPLGLHCWEVWNEPNTAKFWPTRPDADEYGQLFRAVATAIRGVDSRATLLIGGLSPQYDGSAAEVPPAVYLEQLYANGTAQLADGIAAHPYSYPNLPMDPAQRQVGGFVDLPALQTVMTNHGDGAKKIWITEFGAPTGTSVNAVSEQDQATILLQAQQQVAQWNWAGPLMYYELVDGGTDPTDGEQNFGVLRADLSLKAAAQALMDAARARL